jgi:hypothetical protein
MDVALRCDRDTSRSWTRQQICRTIIMEVNRVIGDKHMFGRAFDFAKTRAFYPCLDDDDERKTVLDQMYGFSGLPG